MHTGEKAAKFIDAGERPRKGGQFTGDSRAKALKDVSKIPIACELAQRAGSRRSMPDGNPQQSACNTLSVTREHRCTQALIAAATDELKAFAVAT